MVGNRPARINTALFDDGPLVNGVEPLKCRFKSETAMMVVQFVMNMSDSFLQANGRTIIGNLLELKDAYRYSVSLDELKDLGLSDEELMNPSSVLTYGLQGEFSEIAVTPKGLAVNFDNEFAVTAEGMDRRVTLDEILTAAAEKYSSRAVNVQMRINPLVTMDRQLTARQQVADFMTVTDTHIVRCFRAFQPSIERGLTDDERARQIIRRSSEYRQTGIASRTAVSPRDVTGLAAKQVTAGPKITSPDAPGGGYAQRRRAQMNTSSTASKAIEESISREPDNDDVSIEELPTA